MKKSILTEEINNMKFLFGYKPGRLISEQETPVTTVDLIKQIQTLLNTNYGGKLTVDGKWGPLTQTSLENAIKTIETPAPAPALATPVVASSNVPDEDNSVNPNIATK